MCEKQEFKNLFVCLSIFVTDTKITFVYNFVAPLSKDYKANRHVTLVIQVRMHQVQLFSISLRFRFWIRLDKIKQFSDN